MLEVLSRKIRSRCPEELFDADDLAFLSERLTGLKGTREASKGSLSSKELKINVKKTKIIIRSEDTEKVTEEAKFPCAVCRKGVGSNSILCQFY